MAMSTAAKVGIGIVVGWLGYEMFLAPKPRFVGDLLRKGDRAIVDLNKVPDPEFFDTLMPAGSIGVEVLVTDVDGKDDFVGSIVAGTGSDGRVIPLATPNVALPPRSFRRAAVVEVHRPRSGGDFEKVSV